MIPGKLNRLPMLVGSLFNTSFCLSALPSRSASNWTRLSQSTLISVDASSVGAVLGAGSFLGRSRSNSSRNSRRRASGSPSSVEASAPTASAQRCARRARSSSAGVLRALEELSFRRHSRHSSAVFGRRACSAVPDRSAGRSDGRSAAQQHSHSLRQSNASLRRRESQKATLSHFVPHGINPRSVCHQLSRQAAALKSQRIELCVVRCTAPQLCQRRFWSGLLG